MIGRIEQDKIWFKEDTLETFQVFGVSSLGIWLGDGAGKTGRGIDETSVGGKEICSPGAVVPPICEDVLVAVDELVQVS